MSNKHFKSSNCEHQVTETKTLGECSNVLQPITGVDGPLVAKIPVVIAEPRVQINVESLITLPEFALEIKRILKDLTITQCKLVPAGRMLDGQILFKLFLAGCVRKNIEYATVDSANRTRISGDIKHTTVNVPFECVTEIPLSENVLFFEEEVQGRINFISKDGRGNNPKVFGLNDQQNAFQEMPFCEIVATNINELDIQEDWGRWINGAKTFRKLREKMVIQLQFKVLQTQQVNIPGPNA